MLTTAPLLTKLCPQLCIATLYIIIIFVTLACEGRGQIARSNLVGAFSLFSPSSSR
jgi:hypothetical protein